MRTPAFRQRQPRRSGVSMIGVLLEDMLSDNLLLIECVGLQIEGLWCDIEDFCRLQFLDSWKLQESSEFELQSLKDIQCSLGTDKVCVCPSDMKQFQSTTCCIWSQLNYSRYPAPFPLVPSQSGANPWWQHSYLQVLVENGWQDRAISAQPQPQRLNLDCCPCHCHWQYPTK